MKKYMILVCGKSASGKTACLRNLTNPTGVWYLNCEADNDLPFDDEFKKFTITDPFQVIEGIKAAETKSDVHTIVVDSITYLMDMYVNKYVIPAEDSRAEWGNFALFIQNMFLQTCAASTKNLIFTAHTLEEKNETERVLETKVPVAGKLKNNGIESFFSTIVATKKMSLDDLEDYQNDLITLSDDEKLLGYKHVFQTKPTADTIHERLRGKMGMWSIKETFIDNDIQLVIDRLRKPAAHKAA